jgi:hypothetical protein
MAPPNTTKKKYERKRTSYSSGRGKRGNTKATRQASKAREVAKAAGKSPNSSAKRPRPKSPARPTPSSAKRRVEPAAVTEAEKLVALVLTKCHRDVWWRITPDSYGEDDISVGSRQEWVDLLPILIQAGMLRVIYSGNDGQYQLVYSDASWRKMQHVLAEHHNMALHLSVFQSKGRRKKRRSYYFCVKQKYAGNTEEEEKKKNRLQFTGPSGQMTGPMH